MQLMNFGSLYKVSEVFIQESLHHNSVRPPTDCRVDAAISWGSLRYSIKVPNWQPPPTGFGHGINAELST